jgi:hypothetical protein
VPESVTNRWGAEIRVKQQWVDSGPRHDIRTFRIDELERYDSSVRAVCVVTRVDHTDTDTVSHPRRVMRIDVDRLHDVKGGYRLKSTGN